MISSEVASDALSLLLLPPDGRNGELQNEMAELHKKSNIPSNQARGFLSMSIKDCSNAVAKADIENIDKKIHYAFQTLLFAYW